MLLHEHKSIIHLLAEALDSLVNLILEFIILDLHDFHLLLLQSQVGPVLLNFNHQPLLHVLY